MSSSPRCQNCDWPYNREAVRRIYSRPIGGTLTPIGWTCHKCGWVRLDAA